MQYIFFIQNDLLAVFVLKTMHVGGCGSYSAPLTALQGLLHSLYCPSYQVNFMLSVCPSQTLLSQQAIPNMSWLKPGLYDSIDQVFGVGTEQDMLSSNVFSRALMTIQASTPDLAIIVSNVNIIRDFTLRYPVSRCVSFQFGFNIVRQEAHAHANWNLNVGPSFICTTFPGQGMHERQYEKGTRNVSVTIICRPEVIVELLGENPESYPDWLGNFLTGRSDELNFKIMEMSRSHADLIRPLLEDPISGPMRGRWYEAKSVELLCVALQTIKRMHGPTSIAPRQVGKTRDLGNLSKAYQILEMEYVNPPTLDVLAGRVGLCRTKLATGFKAHFGDTIHAFVTKRRITAAKVLLASGALSVTEVASALGYEAPSAFARQFRKSVGVSPTDWRKDAQESYPS